MKAFAAQLWEELFAKHGEPPLAKPSAEDAYDALMLHADYDESNKNRGGGGSGGGSDDDGSGGRGDSPVDSQRRRSGQRLWQRLLRPGGSTDPHELLRDTLDGKEPELTPFFDAMVK